MCAKLKKSVLCISTGLYISSIHTASIGGNAFKSGINCLPGVTKKCVCNFVAKSVPVDTACEKTREFVIHTNGVNSGVDTNYATVKSLSTRGVDAIGNIANYKVRICGNYKLIFVAFLEVYPIDTVIEEAICAISFVDNNVNKGFYNFKNLCFVSAKRLVIKSGRTAISGFESVTKAFLCVMSIVGFAINIKSLHAIVKIHGELYNTDFLHNILPPIKLLIKVHDKRSRYKRRRFR